MGFSAFVFLPPLTGGLAGVYPPLTPPCVDWSDAKMGWSHLDDQMARWADRLARDVGISADIARKLATTIASEVRFLDPTTKEDVQKTSPVPIQERLDELMAFQGWMDFAATQAGSPLVTRAQVLTQNYVCFVYLSEACFNVLRKKAPTGSATKRCATYLTDNPVRAFRNAVAHANWRYRADFRAIEYWARKGDQKDDPLTRFVVEQEDLSFWQALSRCVGYAAYSNL